MLYLLSNHTINQKAQLALSGRGRSLHYLTLFGPALIAAVAYVDPGNFATNIEAGSRYGYALLWVVLSANIMAMLIQSLSARLGVATGKNLAEMIRDHYPKPLVWFYWLQGEVVAIATDLAEFLGAALAFNLLFDLPLIYGAILTGFITYGALLLQRFGFRLIEILIAAIIFAIVAGFLLELLISPPSTAPLLKGLFVPSFEDKYSIYLSAGIIGATIMPHVIYLHSALLQNRIILKNDDDKRRLMRFYRWDVVIGMSLAGLVNMAILILAATTFHHSGYNNIASISDAEKLLSPLLGSSAASVIFGSMLLLAGLASSIVGTLSGQMLMQGFVNFTIPISLRRLITMLPALFIILLGISEQKALVASQVVLSFGIPFALIPLLLFTSRTTFMGSLVNSRFVTILGSIICSLIILMNFYVLSYTFIG